MANAVVLKVALFDIDGDIVDFLANKPGYEEYTDREKIAAFLEVDSDPISPAILILKNAEGVGAVGFEGQILDMRVENRSEFDEEEEEDDV
jgi:hypothetical protein